MARIGDFLRPELGRTDYSSFQRGSNFGSAQIGQGIASAGRSIGQGMKEKKERQRQAKQSIATAKSMIQYLKKANMMEDEQAETALAFLDNPDKSPSELQGYADFYTKQFNDTLRTGLASKREQRIQSQLDQAMSGTYTLKEAEALAQKFREQGRRVGIQGNSEGRYILSIQDSPKDGGTPNLSGPIGNMIEAETRLNKMIKNAKEAGDEDLVQTLESYKPALEYEKKRLSGQIDEFGMPLEQPESGNKQSEEDDLGFTPEDGSAQQPEAKELTETQEEMRDNRKKNLQGLLQFLGIKKAEVDAPERTTGNPLFLE